MSEIHIGIGELKASRDKEEVLKTTLGSCVGIALYDKERAIGGLAHIMLPKSDGSDNRNTKYADIAIKELLNIMVFRFGASKNRITAKVAGGGNMFQSNKTDDKGTNIGKNNIAAVKEILKKKDIKIIASDIGNNYGRTIEFYINDGKMVVFTPLKTSIEL